MRMFLVLIMCIIINVLSPYITKIITDFISALKKRKALKNMDISDLTRLDNDFWSDFDKDDIDTEEK